MSDPHLERDARLAVALDEARAAWRRRELDAPSWLKRHPDCASELSSLLGILCRADAAVCDWYGELPTHPDSAETAALRADAPNALPERVGRYRILGRIASGGMGTVYRAHDPQLDRIVALKVPRLDPTRDRAAAVARFVREARAAAAIRHRHICPIYDVGEQDGLPYVVMAFVSGPSLAEKLRELQGPMGPDEAVHLASQVAEALEALHSHGITHRDLKPGNILLDADGSALLTDFGLARPGADAEPITATGTVVGTPAYMAPEQAAGPVDRVGPRSDIWSLGAVLYEMLTGRPPFRGEVMEILYHLANDEVPRPSQLRPGLDLRLDAIVGKALARQPEGRYATARAFIEALTPRNPSPAGPLQENIPPLPPTEALPLPARARPRRRWLWAAGALVLLLPLGVGSVVLLSSILGGADNDPPGKADGNNHADQGRDKDSRGAKDDKATTGASADRPRVVPLDLKPEPLQLAVGDSVSPHALVTRPAQIKGVRSWTIETKYPRGRDLNLLALNSDGSRLATLNADGTIRIWDTASRKLLQGICVGQRGLHPNQLAWSPDGKTLATLLEGSAQLWDAARGRLLKTIMEPYTVRCVAWSPSGSRIALLGTRNLSTGDGRVMIWDAPTDKLLPTSLILEGPWSTVAWSPDGKELVGGHGEDGRVDQLDVASDRVTRTLRRNRPDKLPVFGGPPVFSPDGKWLACSGEKTIVVWDLGRGDVRAVIPASASTACRWANAGKTLVAYQHNLIVVVWDAVAKKKLPHDPTLAPLEWTPDGKLFAYYRSPYQSGPNAPAALRLSRSESLPHFDWNDGSAASAVAEWPELKAHVVQALDWTPDGKRVALNTGATYLMKGDLSELPTWFADEVPLWGTHAWSPDGTNLALDGNRGGKAEIDIRETDSRKLLQSVPRGAGNSVVSRSGGDFLFLVDREKDKVGRWDVRTGKMEWIALVDAGPGINGPVSPDGRLIPRSKMPTGGIALWDCVTGKKVRDLERSATPSADGLRWSSDGKLLAGVVFPGHRVIQPAERLPVHVWDAATGQVLQSLMWPPCNLSWSPGQRTLALHQNTGTIDIWDIAAPAPRVQFHAQRESYVPRWSPDGRVIATCSATGLTAFWDAATGKALGRMAGMWDVHGQDAWLLVSPEGHYLLTKGAEVDIVYIVVTEAGQEVLTPTEMERRYGWKNNPGKARLLKQ